MELVGGEVRPKRAAVAKVKPGVTFYSRHYGRHIEVAIHITRKL